MSPAPGHAPSPRLDLPPAPRRTGLLWAVGLRNPLVRIEWYSWKRRFFRQFFLLLVFLACIVAVFMARSGEGVFGRGGGTSGGYSNALYRAIRGSTSQAADFRSIRLRTFWAGVVVNFEKGLMRLTTLLPWLLVIRTTTRLRRMRLWDSLRMTFLTARDWVAGLVGPPIILSTAALGIFLFYLLDDFLGRYGNLPQDLRTQYRIALVSTLPFIGFEGAANGLLVAGITLYEALRSRKVSTVVGRSLAWILGLELAHSLAINGLAMVAETFETGGSYPRYILFSHGFQLTTLAVVKTIAGLILLAWITKTLTQRLQREAERGG